jgi:hypothetical protein
LRLWSSWRFRVSYEAIAGALALDGLSSVERLVAFSLASFANREQRAWPGTTASAARAGLSRSQYLAGRDALVSRGLIEVEQPARGRGHPAVVLLRFALKGPWFDGDVNPSAFERTLGVSRARGCARVLLAVLAALTDDDRRVDRVTTAELCEAAGLAASTYRRARAALLAGDDVTIEDAGGGRGRCNVWQLPDADSQATPQLAPGRRASPHGQDRPPLAVADAAVNVSDSAVTSTSGFGSEGEGQESGGDVVVNPSRGEPVVAGTPVVSPPQSRADTPPQTPPDTPPPYARAGREPWNQRTSPPNPPAGGDRADIVTVIESYRTDRGRRRQRSVTVPLHEARDEFAAIDSTDLEQWRRVRSQLEQEAGEETFAIWFADLRPVAMAREGSLLLTGPAATRVWIEQRFGRLLADAGRSAGQAVRLATDSELAVLDALGVGGDSAATAEGGVRRRVGSGVGPLG